LPGLLEEQVCEFPVIFDPEQVVEEAFDATLPFHQGR